MIFMKKQTLMTCGRIVPFLVVALLMLFTGSMRAVADNEKPTMNVTVKSGYDKVMVNAAKYEPAAVTIYNAAGRNVRGLYKLEYTFTDDYKTTTTVTETNGGTTTTRTVDLKDNDGHVIQEQTATGTRLNTFRGYITVGSNTGTVKIKVTATPTASGKAKGYQPVEGNYSFEVVAPTSFNVLVYNNGKPMTDNDVVSLVTKKTNGTPYSTSQGIDSVKVTYKSPEGNDIDITKCFDITSAGSDAQLSIVPKEKGYTITSTKTSDAEAGTTDNETITFTAKVKPDFASTYGTNATATGTVKVSVKELGTSETVQTHVVWDKQEFSKYKTSFYKSRNAGSDIFYGPHFKIVDDAGNDYTKEYDIDDCISNGTITFKSQDVFKNFSQDPLDYGMDMKDNKGNVVTYFSYAPDYIKKKAPYGDITDATALTIQGLGKDDNRQIQIQGAFPDDYIFTLNAKLKSNSPLKGVISEEAGADSDKTTTVPGMFYTTNQNNKYTIKSNQFVLHSLKRSPTLKLDPDPQKNPIAKNYVMTVENRFDLTGTLDDHDLDWSVPEDTTVMLGYNDRGQYQNDFWYVFFVPDDSKWQSTYYSNVQDSINEEIGLYKTHTGEGKDTKVSDPTGQVKMEVYIGNEQERNERTIENISLAVPAYKRQVDAEGKPTGVYLRDKNGNLIPSMIDNGHGVKVQKDTVVTGTFYTSRKRWGNDSKSSWSITFHGEGYVPIYYVCSFWNYYLFDIGKVSSQVYNIAEHENLKFIIDPKSTQIPVGTTAPAPSVKIVDDYNNDWTKYFSFTNGTGHKGTWVKTNDTNDNITVLNADHSSYGKKAGTATMEVTPYYDPSLDPNKTWNRAKYGALQPVSDTYTVTVEGSTEDMAQYDIIYDANYYKGDSTDGNGLRVPLFSQRETSRMGKLHFIKGGNFYSGAISENEAPGLKITFGNATAGETWTVSDNNAIKTADPDGDFDKDGTATHHYILYGGNALFGDGAAAPSADNPYPTCGGFLKLEPTANGFLALDADYGTKASPIRYTIYDATDKYTQVLNRPELEADGTTAIAEETDWWGEQTTQHPLFAGHTYYLFSPSQKDFPIHGLLYKPAFVVMQSDTKAARTASTFLNTGFKGDLPNLIDKEHADITFTETYATPDYGTDSKGNKQDQWPKSKNGEDVTDYMTVDNAFNINPKKATNANSGAVRVRSAVKGKTHYQSDGTTVKDEVYRNPYLDITIIGVPMYKPVLGEGIFVGKRVTTTNYVTRMWMTYGGWDHGDQENYPYIKDQSKSLSGNTLTDSWEAVKSDTVGADDRTIDGFKYASKGGQNPVDENAERWLSFNKNTTFNLPVRGTYLKFEPEESGTLMVYVLQNGMTDLNDDNPKASVSKADELRYRALYILDENGNTVNVSDKNDNWSLSGVGQYFSGGNNQQTAHQNYVAEGELRCTWKDEFKFKPQWHSSYTSAEQKSFSEPGNVTQADLNNSNTFQQDVNRVKYYWQNTNYGDTIFVLKLTNGAFVTPTKAYVRYTFNVKAGKTYYMFQIGSKLACAGYAFVPDGFMSNSTKWPATTPVDDDYNLNMPDADEKIRNSSNTGADAKNLPEPDDQEVYGEARAVATQDIYDTTQKGDNGADKVNTVSSLDDGEATPTDKPLAEAKRSFVNVKLHRTFTKNRWTSICLPFSVNEHQVKELFGANSILITFDSVMTAHTENGFRTGDTKEIEARTVHFTRHVNQLIEAGRPYFLYPTFDAEEGSTLSSDVTLDANGNATAITFRHVTFEGVDKKTIVCNNENAQSLVKTAKNRLQNGEPILDANGKATGEYTPLTDEQKAYYTKLQNDKQMFTYNFYGTYDRQQIPWYSYVMATKTEDGTEKNGLWRITSSNKTIDMNDKTTFPYLQGFRAYLYPSADFDGTLINNPLTTTGTGDAKAQYLWISGADVYGDNSGTVDGIDDIVNELNAQLTIGVKGVFNVAGQMVRSENDLKGLPAGVYIMNGQKYLIK